MFACEDEQYSADNSQMKYQRGRVGSVNQGDKVGAKDSSEETCPGNVG